MSIIAHLYNFHVVHALLVFDILKKLVTRFSAKDVELVLLVLKNVGFALRKDDPLALKELISEAQRKANAEGERFQDQTRVTRPLSCEEAVFWCLGIIILYLLLIIYLLIQSKLQMRTIEVNHE